MKFFLGVLLSVAVLIVVEALDKDVVVKQYSAEVMYEHPQRMHIVRPSFEQSLMAKELLVEQTAWRGYWRKKCYGLD